MRSLRQMPEGSFCRRAFVMFLTAGSLPAFLRRREAVFKRQEVQDLFLIFRGSCVRGEGKC